MVDVAIIGCGVTGAAVAYQLAKKQVSVLILEAENDVSMGTTQGQQRHSARGLRPGARHQHGPAERAGQRAGEGNLRRAGCAL